MIQDVLMLQFSICFLVDISGFPETIRQIVPAHIPIKPLDCSLCMCFWIILGYMVYQEGLTIYSVFMASVASLSADIATTLLLATKDMLLRLLFYIR